VTVGPVAVVGAGRVGLSFARALVDSGSRVSVLAHSGRRLPRPLADAVVDWHPALAAAAVVLVAVPDPMLEGIAEMLARDGAVGRRQAVLHCSGLRDRTALKALGETGAALGSLHPVQSFVLPDGEPGLLAGSAAVVEGDDRARSVAGQIAAQLGMAPIVAIEGSRKPLHHAAAVFASGYLVVLAEVAARLGAAAGAGDAAAALYRPIMQRTAARLAAGDAPWQILTGPVRRGDVMTIERHLAVLAGDDGELYRALGREALVIARRAGLDPAAARLIEAALATAR
jgi:predicted short-subunit dehydrogenase-like oxidoreductase (DUF2520 family)